MDLEQLDWIKYIAVDADGLVYGHENEPLLGIDRWVSIGRKEVLDFLKGNKEHWKQSLLKKES
jgi:hypothetical protein